MPVMTFVCIYYILSCGFIYCKLVVIFFQDFLEGSKELCLVVADVVEMTSIVTLSGVLITLYFVLYIRYQNTLSSNCLVAVLLTLTHIVNSSYPLLIGND